MQTRTHIYKDLDTVTKHTKKWDSPKHVLGHITAKSMQTPSVATYFSALLIIIIIIILIIIIIIIIGVVILKIIIIGCLNWRAATSINVKLLI